MIASGTTERLQITAGNGIGEIRTLQEGTNAVLVLNTDADIFTNKQMLDDPDQFPSQVPALDGVLALLETAGDLHGSIRAGNITCSSYLTNSCQRVGIYVHGVSYASIHVDLTVYLAELVARSFLGEVRIGRFMKGSVVAVGGAETPSPLPPGFADGRIESIVIGRDPLPPWAMGTFYADMGPGLCGVSLGGSCFAVFQPADRDDWFDGHDCDGNASDGVIHAEASIGTADIVSLSLTEFRGVTQFCKQNPPAIEAPYIESLTIDDFASGSIWSGLYEADDISENYAVIDGLRIGCTRKTVAIWMKDWEEAVFTHNVFGDIHVPEVESDRMILIGGILGDYDNTIYDNTELRCACNPWQQGFCESCDVLYNANVALENGRNPDFPVCGTTPDQRGRVWVHENQGLHGQIIINANNTGLSEAALWTGAVQVGEDSGGCPLMEVSPTPSSNEWTSPYYTGLSASLGGGAIGLVPFKMHRTDCRPAAASDLATYRTFLNSVFCGELAPSNAQPHLIHVFYGPVTTNHASNSPLEVRLDGGETVAREQWMKIELRRNGTGALSREVDLTGDGLTRLLPGTYRSKGVTTAQTGQSVLLCDGLLTTASVPVAVFEEGDEYVFVLDPDCDADGANDNVEIANDQSLDLWPMDGLLDFCYFGNCDADVNCDSNLDSFDVAVMELAVQADYTDYCVAGNDADFNRDGNVDGFDVQALENAIGGTCPWD